MLKTTRARADDEDVSDEEATMDILHHSPIGVGSSEPFNYASAFQSINECLDTISLDVQQICLDHQEGMHTLTGEFHVY